MSRSAYKKIITVAFFFTIAVVFMPSKADAACAVSSVAMRPNGVQPTQTGDTDPPTPDDFPGPNNPYRNENTGYGNEGYNDDNPNFPPFVYADVSTSGCTNDSLIFSVKTHVEATDGVEAVLEEIVVVTTNSDYVYMPGHTAHSSSFTVAYRAGDRYCTAEDSVFDCQIFLEIKNSDGQLLFSKGTAQQPTLLYECELPCGPTGANWLFVGVQDFGVSLDAPMGVDLGDFDYFTEGYDQYLAPLPGFTATTTSTLGGFLKGLFTVLVMVAGILAFIMLVLGGITYATADAISGKTSGKEMMLNAVLGLIIALGAWVILNSINPNLASNLSITIPKANFIPRYEPETGVGENVETITLNLVGGGTTTMTACDETKIVPITAFGKTFRIHQGLVTNIQAVEQQWLAMPEDQRYKITSIGGYNCRKVKGTQTWSSHAFGTAVDINPNKNPFTSGPLVTDMPPSFVQLWTSHGWGWGGGWDSVKDAMHFSKYPTAEDGDATISP